MSGVAVRKPDGQGKSRTRQGITGDCPQFPHRKDQEAMEEAGLGLGMPREMYLAPSVLTGCVVLRTVNSGYFTQTA